MTRNRPAVFFLVVLLLTFSQVAASPDVTALKVCTELFPGRTSILPGVKGADLIKCRWPEGTRVLKVRFLEGDPRVQQKVRFYANQWTQYSGIAFEFGNAADAKVRISFSKPGSWSYIGACQWDVKEEAATMNFGWLTPTTNDIEYRRVVLHEFGHALGLVHEHQNPDAPIAWNLSVLYDYYQRTEGWDKDYTYANVVKKYSEAETNHTAYDRDSIMEYPIPAELITSGTPVGWNTDLSTLDKEFIGQLYHR